MTVTVTIPIEGLTFIVYSTQRLRLFFPAPPLVLWLEIIYTDAADAAAATSVVTTWGPTTGLPLSFLFR